MERLLKKWETAAKLLPKPEITLAGEDPRLGVIFYGSTTPVAHEVIDHIQQRGCTVNSMRIRAFPFQEEVWDFIRAHDHVVVIEQNRDGQMRTLLINEGDLSPQKLLSVVRYDGLPVTSRQLITAMEKTLAAHGLLVPATSTATGDPS